MACTWVCIVKQRMSCLYVWKLKLQVLFQKRNWNFAFAFEHLWHDFELLNLLFKIASHNWWETTLKCFVTMPLWQFNNLGIILCHQSFLLHCLSLTCWKHIFFLESIYFFSYGFENLEHLSQFKCCAKRVSNCFYCFNGITVNQLKSMTLAMSNRLNLIYARCYSSLRTKLVGCPIRP